MTRSALLALAIAAAATPAGAQPAGKPRYPRPPVDEDRAREQRSGLWEAATHPAKAPYAAALDAARRKLGEGDYAGAIAIADDAKKLVPDAPDAYIVAGEARLRGKADWAGCTDDLAAALAHTPADKPPDNASGLRRDLGVCQARAGKLADAEATLADAAAMLAPNDRERTEVWMRLGEVRVAMGKLDEAIAAFDAAAPDGNNPPPQVLWMRAGAYDRARQPGRAEDDVHAAMLSDRSLSMIDNGALPLLGAGEHELMYGVAWKYAESPSVESAIHYFKRFLAVAPASPWRRRAEEHLRELTAMPLPVAVVRTSGNAAYDGDAVTKLVQGAMPKLRACLVKVPSALLEVRITRTGPATTAREGIPRRWRPPPAGVQTTPLLPVDEKPGDLDDAIRCLEPLADKLPLPAVKEKDAFYQLSFDVIAP